MRFELGDNPEFSYSWVDRPDTLEAESRLPRHRTAVKRTDAWTANANVLSKVVQAGCDSQDLGLARDITTPHPRPVPRLCKPSPTSL